MTNLIEEYNSWSRHVRKTEQLQKKLAEVIAPELKDLCNSTKAAVWLEIFNRLTEIDGLIPDTVINGVITRAVEKYDDEPDTQDNLVLALMAAERYNVQKSRQIHEFFAFINDVERVFTDAFESARESNIVWRSPREL